MADFVATSALSFGAANSIAGLLINPQDSNKTATIRKLAAVPTNGHIPNAILRRIAGAAYTPIQNTTPPAIMKLASSSAAAHAIATTSSDHTYSGGTGNFEIVMALYQQTESAIVLAPGESLAVVMSEDGSGASALFAVEWTEP